DRRYLGDDGFRHRHQFDVARYRDAGRVEATLHPGHALFPRIAQDLLALCRRQPDLAGGARVGPSATLPADLDRLARLGLDDDDFVLDDDIVIAAIFRNDLDDIRRQRPRAHPGGQRLADIDADIDVDIAACAGADQRLAHAAGLVLRDVDGADHVDIA